MTYLRPETENTVVAAFTEMAPRYETTVDHELRTFWGVGYATFIERLLDRLHLPAAGLVLDVATGRAAIPFALTRRNEWQGRAVGVDLTPAMLQGARETLAHAGQPDRIRLVCGSGMQLPFARGTFHAALCAFATHHMDLPRLLREMHRVLRPGGQLLVVDVALASLWNTSGGRVLLHSLAWLYARREGATRLRAEMDALPNMHTPERWCAVLAEAGFTPREAARIPARRPWYPPGILIDANATHRSNT